MYRHYTLVLDGTAQRLSSVLGGTGDARQDKHFLLMSVSLQPDAGNANPVFVGGGGVTAADHAVRLEVPDGGVPPAPYLFEFSRPALHLSDLWVIGTAGETLRIGIVPYI